MDNPDCLWLVRLADKHGMAVGRVVCTGNVAYLADGGSLAC